MTILGPCVKIPPRRLNLIFSTDPAKLVRFRLKIYSLGLFRNPPSRGFILIFISGTRESNKRSHTLATGKRDFGPFC